MRIEELTMEIEHHRRTNGVLNGQINVLEARLAKAKRDLESATAAATSSAKLAAARQNTIDAWSKEWSEERKRWKHEREILEAKLREAQDAIAKLQQRPSLSKMVGDTIRNVKGAR